MAMDGSSASLAARLARVVLNRVLVAGITVLAVVEPLDTATFYTGYGDVISADAAIELTASAERAAHDATMRPARPRSGYSANRLDGLT